VFISAKFELGILAVLDMGIAFYVYKLDKTKKILWGIPLAKLSRRQIDIKDVIDNLTLEQKCAFVCGENLWSASSLDVEDVLPIKFAYAQWNWRPLPV